MCEIKGSPSIRPENLLADTHKHMWLVPDGANAKQQGGLIQRYIPSLRLGAKDLIFAWVLASGEGVRPALKTKRLWHMMLSWSLAFCFTTHGWTRTNRMPVITRPRGRKAGACTAE